MKPQTSTKAHSERINFRLEPKKKYLIEEAAAARGLTLTQFAISTLEKEAQAVVQNAHLLVLSDRDRDAFLTALDHPPAPNHNLLKAAKHYKMARADGRLNSI